MCSVHTVNIVQCMIMLSDCWLKWHVSCVWYYLYMAILHAHVPSFVSASLCMALFSVIIMPSFVSTSHRLALDLYSIVGLSITSPGSHVPQHRWSQHHVSRLALMLALMCLAVAIHSLSHIHALRKRSTVCPLKTRSTVFSNTLYGHERLKGLLLRDPEGIARQDTQK